MIRSLPTLPVAALAIVATLGLASAASFEHTRGPVASVDRSTQSLELRDGTTFHFRSVSAMRNLHPGASVEIAYANDGARNTVAHFQTQPRR